MGIPKSARGRLDVRHGRESAVGRAKSRRRSGCPCSSPSSAIRRRPLQIPPPEWPPLLLTRPPRHRERDHQRDMAAPSSCPSPDAPWRRRPRPPRMRLRWWGAGERGGGGGGAVGRRGEMRRWWWGGSGRCEAATQTTDLEWRRCGARGEERERGIGFGVVYICLLMRTLPTSHVHLHLQHQKHHVHLHQQHRKHLRHHLHH
jgi:hypothetical protein